MFEVPARLELLNHGDCFLLEDEGARRMWVWHGRAAHFREKRRALEAASAFREGTAITVGGEC